MAYEERLQSDGAIYTNNYKQTDKQPDWTGKVALTKGLLKELVTKIKEDRADSVERQSWMTSMMKSHSRPAKEEGGEIRSFFNDSKS